MSPPSGRPADAEGFERWQEQLRRGGLELAILLTVAGRPRYGLDIIRHLEAFTDLVVNEGTIYPILARLSRDGWLASEWRQEGPHPRKYYRLTARGGARMAEMTTSWNDFAAKLGRLIEAAKGDGHETH
jgi:PadR family transcriptional regulator PadR